MVKFQRLRISAIVCESKVVNASDAISHSHSHRGFSPVIETGEEAREPFQRFPLWHNRAAVRETVETVILGLRTVGHRAKATV